MTTIIELPYKDRTWGIDRYIHSKDFGELVVPTVLLWRVPGCKAAEDNLTGVLAHDYEVTVEKRKLHKDHDYYFITADVEHEGKVYHQKGWVSGRLLKELGKHELAMIQGNGNG
jgi:hypothetical protein